RGMSHVSNGTFTICHRAPLHSHGKLVISVQGRVRGARLVQACPLSRGRKHQRAGGAFASPSASSRFACTVCPRFPTNLQYPDCHSSGACGHCARFFQSGSAMQASRGFTLIELMIAVSLLAIVAALAAPAMGDFLVRQRVASQAGDLALAMALARSEAIKDSASVAVLPRTLSPSGWGDGWCVAPADVASCDDARGLRHCPARGHVTIATANLASPFHIVFLRDGTRGVASGRPRFKVSSAQLPAGGQARCVLLTPQGRVEVTTVARDIDCPA